MFITPFFQKQRWFVFSVLSLLLGGIYTVIFATGVFLYPMLHIEQWLLLRPITRVDCVLTQWARIGEADITFGLACVLGVVCILLGYRKRVLPYLLLLFLLGVGIELIGKHTFPQQVPVVVQRSLNALHCPLLENQPRQTRYLVTLGAWWVAPPITQETRQHAQRGAMAPLLFNARTAFVYWYPSGHTIRWTFLGLLACWLSVQHVRRRLLRRILVVLTSLIAFGGGFAQFYIGYHYSTDLIIGYLLGISGACCMIGLLIYNRKSTLPVVTGIDAGEHKHVSFFNRR